MKKVFLLLSTLLVTSTLAVSMAVPALAACGTEGCTPGFWKNHTGLWEGYGPDDTLEDVFDVPDDLGLDDKTLLEALRFRGGKGPEGGARILLRAGVAGLLNAAHPGCAYTSVGWLIDRVNTALATGDRGAMLDVATQLDGFNNRGCSLCED